MARHDEETQTPTTPSGKGRPTPKRNEVERARRRPVAAPTTGKEASKQRRLEAAEQRMKIRQAMATGDERGLPTRDRGPVRRYVRNFVDVRLSLSEWFVPAAVPLYMIMLFGGGTRAGALASLAILFYILFVVIELVVLTLQLNRKLKAKFPDESRKGARLYAVMRSAQMRRLRAPKPQIKRFATLD